MLTATDQGGAMEYENAPEGMFTAICYRVIDRGTQENKFNPDKPQHKVLLSFEIQDEDAGRMKDGRPFSTHKTYTVSLNERATLRKHLESWRGKKFTDEELKGFELSDLVGKACSVQLIEETKKDGSGTYISLNNILPTKEKDVVNENDTVLLDLDADNAQEVLGTLSRNMQEQIVATPEGQEKGLKVVEREEPVIEISPAKNGTVQTVPPVDEKEIDLSEMPDFPEK